MAGIVSLYGNRVMIRTTNCISKKLILYVYGCLAYICVCTLHVPGAHGGQKRAVDFLELKLQWL